MKFQEPKFEMIRVETNQVVFASGAGSLIYCIGPNMINCDDADYQWLASDDE